jgi:hypothetical protein
VKKKQGGNISIDSKGELIICSVDWIIDLGRHSLIYWLLNDRILK